MRRKTIILTTIIFLLTTLLLLVLFVMKVRGLLFQEKIEHAVIDDKFNISSSKTPLLACIFGITEDGEYWCYNKEGFGFLETNLLDTYLNLEDFDKGLVFIQPKGNNLEKYDVDIEGIYTKWYEEINEKERVFYINKTELTLIDLYSLMKWKELEVKTKNIDESDLKNELESILESIKKSETFTLFPMSKQSLDYLCTIVPKDCDYWQSYYKERGEYTILEIIKKYNMEGDFTDKKETYSALRTYIIGTSSEGSSNNPTGEYLEFITKIKENDESMTDEKINFLGKYFFRDYFDYSDQLYEGWQNNKEHYYKFLDLVCNIDTCVNIKLDILFDEYKT